MDTPFMMDHGGSSDLCFETMNLFSPKIWRLLHKFPVLFYIHDTLAHPIIDSHLLQSNFSASSNSSSILQLDAG